jgi:hypothetical protein
MISVIGVCLCSRKAALYRWNPASLQSASGRVTLDRFTVDVIRLTASVEYLLEAQ